jgi:hypothetical protein
MKLHTIGIVLVLAVISFAAYAATTPDLSHAIDPGAWTYAVEAKMQIGQMTIPTSKLSYQKCVTQKDLDKNKNWFKRTQKQCAMKNVSYVGHVVNFTQKCRLGGGAMTIRGKITLNSRTIFHGTFDTTGTVGGKKVEGHTTITARRTGRCTPAKSGQ